MTSTIYIPRKVTCENRTFDEAELLSASQLIVVLAEPGGGKTRLMESLAQKLGVPCVTANMFRFSSNDRLNCPLVIDAFDELAMIDVQGIYKLLGAAKAKTPTHVVISSRSSEWGNSETSAFEQFFKQPPLVVRLQEFDESEQRAIFDHYTSGTGEDFLAFQKEVARFDLEVLLPNPQFLQLFVGAYLESNRSFENKRSIFSQAVEHLAKEANSSIGLRSGSLSSIEKAKVASEVFAKLLLSGAEGVSTNEAKEGRLYPQLGSLVTNATSVNSILSTKLFKPSETESRHSPVHKIVAEYAAADYLTKRIMAPDDALTVSQCQPIIAPNLKLRDELRGLLGWIAALGNLEIQQFAIDLDPYAVLANGDPSQLGAASKRLLVNRLKATEEKDPLFRRGDSWRRFSVAGFFTREVVEEIKPLLTPPSEGHLRDLILELLPGSPTAITILQDELRELLLSPDTNPNTRRLANNCLLDQGIAHDHNMSLTALILEGSHTSLACAAKTIERLCYKKFDQVFLAYFFKKCAHLYPDHTQLSESSPGQRYFVKRLIGKFDLATIESLLNQLTSNLTCTCFERNYECDCRNGISKIIGSMLDRYFDLEKSPLDPLSVWGWVRNLNFSESRTTFDRSRSEKELRANTELRHGILTLAFGALTCSEEIKATRTSNFGSNSFSGLELSHEDHQFIVKLAFETDNLELWLCFLAHHKYYRRRDDRGPDDLRRLMRHQARSSPTFMREWSMANRAVERNIRKYRLEDLRRARSTKRFEKKRLANRAANIRFVRENRTLIESGQHWSCLVRFARLMLGRPERIEVEFGEESIVRNALRSCIKFIEPHVPNLSKQAELQCSSCVEYSEDILYAACLEILRSDGDLNKVPVDLVKALKRSMNIRHGAVSDEEQRALQAEVDRLAFSSTDKVEEFCRQYIEPQLRGLDCNFPDVNMLRHDPTFKTIAPALSLEWLTNYEVMPMHALETLFEIAANHCDRAKIGSLIAYKCAEMLLFWSPQQTRKSLNERRTFWFLRAFYFLPGTDTPYWEFLKADKDSLFLFSGVAHSMTLTGNPWWPILTSDKVEALLDAFFVQWPKVPLSSILESGGRNAESAYRFLTEVVWVINSDDPDIAIPTLERLLSDNRYADLHVDMKSMLSGLERRFAHRGFEPPSAREIVNLLDKNEIVTVEGLRRRVLEELANLQKAIDGGEFNTADRFYAGKKRLNEEPCTRIVAERLNLILQPQNITITPEHHLKHDRRSDFTAAKVLGGKRRLLVTEVKGQWHRRLFSAAKEQLNDLYAIHPEAERQGIYLVIWFGAHEKVNGKKRHDLNSAAELKTEIERQVPSDLHGLIDVFVLDVSNRATCHA